MRLRRASRGRNFDAEEGPLRTLWCAYADVRVCAPDRPRGVRDWDVNCALYLVELAVRLTASRQGQLLVWLGRNAIRVINAHEAAVSVVQVGSCVAVCDRGHGISPPAVRGKCRPLVRWRRQQTPCLVP